MRLRGTCAGQRRPRFDQTQPAGPRRWCSQAIRIRWAAWRAGRGMSSPCCRMRRCACPAGFRNLAARSRRRRKRSALPAEKISAFRCGKRQSFVPCQPIEAGLRVIAAVALEQRGRRLRIRVSRSRLHPGSGDALHAGGAGRRAMRRPTLVVKVDARTTSIAILDKQQLLLFRTLENASGT